MGVKIMANWNVYILSTGRINVKSTDIIAPRIGICASDIEFHTSSLDTSSRGCKSDTGMGHGKRTDHCAGSGGAHGGIGGHGGSESENQKMQEACEANFP